MNGTERHQYEIYLRDAMAAIKRAAAELQRVSVANLSAAKAINLTIHRIEYRMIGIDRFGEIMELDGEENE